MSFLKRLFGSAEAGGKHEAASQPPARRDIDAAGLAGRLKETPPPFLLDVREPQEYVGGHIAGAVLLPLGDLQRRLGELPQDREIVCVCQSGSRSSAATRLLAGMSYNATNLIGGMIGWARAGLPIQRGNR
jgi:rhodanese-related sulfurtransferase